MAKARSSSWLRRRTCFVWLVLVAAAWRAAQAQQSFSWQQIQQKFEATNPTLQADQLNVDESRAQEITAYLRPNPGFSVTVDGTQIAPNQGIWQPLAGTFVVPGITYLHERDHKRELRLESAKKGTVVAELSHTDLQRTLVFTLRSAFVSTLQAKAVLQLAKSDLEYWDRVLKVSRDRLEAGDIAQIDFDRLELQRVQYESELQTAEVNLRTSKIQLLTLLNDRTAIDQFDVTGPYEFADQLQVLADVRNVALDTRPDLKAAVESIDKANTDHQLAIANGSTDPTFGGWWTYNASTNNAVARQTIGFSLSIPLRIFDRNQGEKLRTQLDITRNEKLRDATEAQVLSDVDSGYATLSSTLTLLRPYKAKYLQEAIHVRDTVYFAYQNGGASLLDFLSAESDYRAVQLNYVNLVGSYLTAAAQLNMAVGREVVP